MNIKLLGKIEILHLTKNNSDGIHFQVSDCFISRIASNYGSADWLTFASINSSYYINNSKDIHWRKDL
jgi:hypothetical protein